MKYELPPNHGIKGPPGFSIGMDEKGYFIQVEGQTHWYETKEAMISKADDIIKNNFAFS